MTTHEDNDTGLDFGSGNMVALPSRCLRIAKDPTDCDICAEACPVQAITVKPFIDETEEEASSEGVSHKTKAQLQAEKRVGVVFDHDVCINCAICTTICPLEALTTTKTHPKGFEKQLKEISDKFEGVAIGCARALFGSSQRLTEHAITLPCLADLTTEAWFLAATMARDAVFDPQEGVDSDVVGNLKILLPPCICDDCPVNEGGVAEQTYTEAISTAEAWGAYNIELVSAAEELPFYHSGKLISTLSEVSSDGKRELVEQLAADFSRSWQSAGNDLARQKLKAELLAKKRKKVKKPPATNINAPRPFGKKSQRRSLLRTALMQDEGLAEDIELISSDTEVSLCDGCGTCVQACPLNARRRVSSNSVLYFGKLPESERPREEQAAVTDKLCCLGCSACVQVCPTGACKLSWIDGEEFYQLRQN